MITPFRRLTGFGLFRTLTQKEQDVVDRLLVSSEKRYAAGEIVHMRDDVLTGLLVLTRGEIVVEIQGMNARTLQVIGARAPEVIAPAYGSSRAGLPATIRCTKDCSLSLLPESSFVPLLQDNRQFLESFLALVSSRIGRLTRKMEFLNFHTIRRKLAWYLLSLPEKEDIVRLPQSITELADLFGVQRPSLSTVLGDYCREKVLQKEGRRIIRILDRDALIAEVEQS